MQYINSYFTFLREIFNEAAQTLEDGAMGGFILAASVLIPVFGTLFFFAMLVNAEEPTALPEQTATFATTQTSDHTFDITVTDLTTAVNAAEVELTFNPTDIFVYNVAITDTLCEERFTITKEVDNDSGSIFYQCGTISPFTGTSSTLATVSYIPLQTGTTFLSFGPQTNVLAYNGLGSNVTKDRKNTKLSLAR